MPYFQLTSEKYYAEAVNQELKEIRRQKNRAATRAFCNFMFVVAVLVGVGAALQTMPTWLPSIVGFLELLDVIPAQTTLPS